MRVQPGAILAGLALAFLLLRPGRAAASPGYDPTTNDIQAAPREADLNPDYNPTSSNPQEIAMTTPTVSEVGMPAAVAAFLYMIRASEHVYPRDVVNDDCYGIFYGGARFSDFSEHPVITGEMKPVPLSDAMCRAAGRAPGCVTTAAGAYQIIRPTWIRMRDKLGLTDFSPASQDRAAIELLEESGAMERLGLDDILGAISKASTVWASLPGSTAQQNPKTVAYALERYNDGLQLA
jgi:muramidase (phage lysozyme)